MIYYSSDSEESSFHFLPSTGTSSSNHHLVVGSSLCHEVPALLGLGSSGSATKNHRHQYQYRHHDEKQPSGKSSRSGHGSTTTTSSTTSSSSSSTNGFYKRLLEWLSRKKKSHRRYSEVVLPEHCPVDPHCRETLHGLMAVASAGRNQSAPMIFDVSRPIRSTAAVGNFRHVPVSHSRPAGRESSRIEDSSTTVQNEIGGSHKSTSSSSSSSSSTSSSSTSSLSSSSTVSSSSSTALQPPQPLVIDTCNTPNRLGVDFGLEAPPTTPTSSYSQSGIIQFEKQESEDKGQEIDAEWIIPWSDIQVGQIISKRGSCTINR